MREISESTIEPLRNSLKNELDKTGIYYRLFSRIKSTASIQTKIQRKKKERGENYKIQDLVGIRIVLYFLDDIDVCDTLIRNNFDIDEANCNIKKPTKNTFEAVIHNYICKLPDDTVTLIGEDFFSDNSIDKTFEIQLRTVFSEGWHEIDHDLRYKMKDAWKNHENEERALNSIMASLENCNWSILALLDNLAYKNYKSNEWEFMIRNKFRIHFDSTPLSDALLKLLNDSGNTLAKRIFRSNREQVLMEFRKGIPFNLNNLVYIVLVLEKMENLHPVPIPIKEKLIKNRSSQINKTL